jgi:predicted SprT family Zn-dependent metalloprotease
MVPDRPYSQVMKLKMTKREVIQKAKRVLEQEGVTYEIKAEEACGWAYPKDSHVIVGTLGYDTDQLASVFCHELAHVLNFRNRKYFRYHNGGFDFDLSPELCKMRIQIGLKAEIYTDMVAKKLMRKYYPGMKFIPSYSKKWQRDWYHKNILGQCREFLEGVK